MRPVLESVLRAPLPRTRGRGVGVRGRAARVLPPHPRPLSPEAGERGDCWSRLFLALAALVLVAGPLRAQDELPPLLREVGIDQQLDAQVPLDLVFRDEGGRDVRLGEYFGQKPV